MLDRCFGVTAQKKYNWLITLNMQHFNLSFFKTWVFSCFILSLKIYFLVLLRVFSVRLRLSVISVENPEVYKTGLRCYILSRLQLAGAEISVQLFQISSCCFPLDFLCAFKGQPRIWGKFICWFEDSLPVVPSFSGFFSSIYSSSVSPELCPLTPQFDKTTDYCLNYNCPVPCEWGNAFAEKWNKCGFDSVPFNSFKGWIYIISACFGSF